MLMTWWQGDKTRAMHAQAGAAAADSVDLTFTHPSLADD